MVALGRDELCTEALQKKAEGGGGAKNQKKKRGKGSPGGEKQEDSSPLSDFIFLFGFKAGREKKNKTTITIENYQITSS